MRSAPFAALALAMAAGSLTGVDGTPGTVLEPSGFLADNPDDQSQDNCDNASNPLLEFVQVQCCARPEIR